MIRISMFHRPLRWVGFTIIEILIAIVVLVLGITGIIALFPTAIESGNQTVEDSYAAAITQSVVDALTVGIREARYVYDIDPAQIGDEWTYFIFNHDGVVDPLPLQPEKYSSGVQQQATPGGYAPGVPTGASGNTALPRLFDRDYCVLLPRAVQLGPSGVGTGPLVTPTNKDVTREPFFLYPVPLTPGEENQRDENSLAGGNVVDNLAVDRQRPQLDGTPTAWIPRVYPLGTYRDPIGTPFSLPNMASGASYLPGHIRNEFRGEQVMGEDTIATDPYPNYSFAFAMRRARIDSNENGRIDEAGAVATQDDFSDSLYLLRIYIFKNFNQADADALAPGLNAGSAVPRTNVPVRKFVTLISL